MKPKLCVYQGIAELTSNLPFPMRQAASVQINQTSLAHFDTHIFQCAAYAQDPL